MIMNFKCDHYLSPRVLAPLIYTEDEPLSHYAVFCLPSVFKCEPIADIPSEHKSFEAVYRYRNYDELRKIYWFELDGVRIR